MKVCAACGKLVYPLEEFRCLDKVWHKSCYRCQKCNKVLNVSNSKGYEGLPYCTAHYPEFKSFTFVADTPERQQVATNTRNMSKIKYYEDYEHTKGSKISVKEDRISLGQHKIASNIDHRNYAQPLQPSSGYAGVPMGPTYESTKLTANNSPLNLRTTLANTPSINTATAPTNTSATNGGAKIYLSNGNTFESGAARTSNGVSSWYSESVAYPQANDHGYGSDRAASKRNSISPAETRSPDAFVAQVSQLTSEPQQEFTAVYPKLIFRDGMPVTGSGKHFRAVFDYDATDDDEVTFREGDVLLHGQMIDDGWMYGTVKRTGQFGMLPSNYVVPALDSTGRA